MGTVVEDCTEVISKDVIKDLSHKAKAKDLTFKAKDHNFVI